ncbi:MAG: AMP-binding enzyme [Acidimicrobiales bacterium]
MPDTQWGEVIVAVIVLSNGSNLPVEEVKAFVKDQLRSSRTPDHIVTMDELPYNETGKLLRRVLRENLSDFSIDEG